MNLLLLTLANGDRQSATTYLLVFCAIATLVILVWLVDRLLPNKKHRTATGNALMSAEAFFRPSRKHAIEMRERKEEVEQEYEGDPPKSGATPE